MINPGAVHDEIDKAVRDAPGIKEEHPDKSRHNRREHRGGIEQKLQYLLSLLPGDKNQTQNKGQNSQGDKRLQGKDQRYLDGIVKALRREDLNVILKTHKRRFPEGKELYVEKGIPESIHHGIKGKKQKKQNRGEDEYPAPDGFLLFYSFIFHKTLRLFLILLLIE